MRRVVLDTETTGLEPEQGHRIIEIGCVEILDRRLTGATWHRYLNPERDIDAGASEVHGLTREDLADKPVFADIADELMDFLRGAELIIHNARFDVGFLDHELQMLGGKRGRIEDHCTVVDTLDKARAKHPGQRNSLDALCKRYDVDNTHRVQHGALLDAQILAEVYLRMTGGQVGLLLAAEDADQDWRTGDRQRPSLAELPRPPVRRASAAELTAHQEYLAGLREAAGGRCLWDPAEPEPAVATE